MTSFTLKSDDNFKARQKSVFDQLEMLESNRKTEEFNQENNEYNVETMETEEDEIDTLQSRAYWDAKRASKNQERSLERKGTNKSHNMKQFKGKESIFKKPQMPAPKNFINRMPDFKKNPHKWTKYSLEDVADMTDESNKKSAMNFLKELADRKRLENDDSMEEKVEELPTKIMFKKHTTKNLRKDSESTTPNTTPEGEKPSFQSSKLVMPEYVIGHTTKKEKKIKAGKPEKGKELKLDHLAFEDDNE